MKFVYTNGGNSDFIELCHSLDSFLNELVGGEENRAEYIPYNQLDDIHDVIVVYDDDIPAEVIASIILKEQYTQSIPDRLAMADTKLRDISHSVGLGAITPEIAKDSWKKVNGVDYNNLSNYEIQKLLEDDEFNINTIAVILRYEIYSRKENTGEVAEFDDITYALYKYNGSQRYAHLVNEYLEDMKGYLSYE